MRPNLRRGLALLAALLPLPALAAPRVVGRAAGGHAPLVVYGQGGGEELIVENAGQTTRLPTPPGLRLVAAHRIGSGWLLAGARPTEEGSELWIARDGGEVVPPKGAGRLRMNPMPLVSGESLVGLAWLEGDGRRQLAVKFAPWQDGAFGAAFEVSPPGPGSQLALTGVRLADGRLMLAWSGFDGEDDEVWVAWSTAGGWSAPQRVGGDNHVPDITPDLIADGAGAWLAWSRFDGSEYQLVVSRFDGRRFDSPRPLGEPGSIDASFEPFAGGVAVLYRDARRDSWALVELAPDGKPGRVSRLDAPATERPAVEWTARGPVWTLGARTAATAWE